MEQSLCEAFKVSATAQLHRWAASHLGKGDTQKLLAVFRTKVLQGCFKSVQLKQ
jgi:hypothetical protein